jgi:hypothetical protein
VPRQAIFSVKAGHVTSSYVRDLVGVLTREKAQIGILISFEEPTRDMRKEAASAGWTKSWTFSLRKVARDCRGIDAKLPRIG